MYLKLLGVVQVSWEKGTPPRFRSQRTVALLGYLVAEQRPLTREFLAALFWPDEDPSKGKANLRRELHNLAQILPGCWQTSRAEVAFLSGETVTVDLYQFQQYEADQQWTAVADLIGGVFLEGIALTKNLAFETWLLGEQERWRQKAEFILNQAVRQLQSQGLFRQALSYAKRLLQLMPWHEETHRQVMRLLALDGQRSAALKQYAVCKQLLDEELGVAVSAETEALYQRIKRYANFSMHNLPAAITPFIGREQELTLLASWLNDPAVRLINITGAGGMGKSRLAFAVGDRFLDKTRTQPLAPFVDGIYFTSLASLDNPDQIVFAIIRALELFVHTDDGRSLQQQLLDYLSAKKMLLILDNFEHLLSGTATIQEILDRASNIKIVVTSRERLGMTAEQLLPLDGLTYELEEKDPAGNDYAAPQLFLTSARRIRPQINFSTADQKAINQLCRLVEGMPLALELAAKWIDSLSLPNIIAEISQNLSFLETAAPDLARRHRSMQAVFNSSWGRLTANQQTVLAGLSVFQGGFTFDAAKYVTGTFSKTLSLLVSRSLLHYDLAAERYTMHDLLRQYAAEKLVNDHSVKIRQCHLAYFAQLAQKEKAKFNTIAYQANLNKWVAELGNIMTALNWSLEDHASRLDGLKLAGALEDFWLGSGFVRQAHDCLVTLFRFETTDAPMKTQAIALRTLGRLEFLLTGNDESAIILCQQSLTLQEMSGDDSERIRTLCSLGQIERQRFKLTEAEKYYQQAFEISTNLNNLWGKSTALHGLGALKLQQRDFRNALAFATEGLSIAKQLGSSERSAHLLTLLGMVTIERQDWHNAYSLIQEALKLYQHIGHRIGEKNALTSLGEIARIEDDYTKAAQLYQDSLIITRDQGTPWAISIALFNLGQTALMLDETHQAFAYLNEGILLAIQLSDPILIQTFIEGFANLAACQNLSQSAAVLWGAAEVAREKSNDVFDIADQLQHDHFLARARHDMDEITFKHLWREGRQMTLDQAVNMALTAFK